jgi:hypothetical protein
LSAAGDANLAAAPVGGHGIHVGGHEEGTWP